MFSTATLRLEISAPASGGNEARRLTVDYTADIAPSLEFDDFSDPPIVVAANATMNTPVLTISADQSRVLFFLRADRPTPISQSMASTTM